MSGKVYILILNWNNWKDTIACLESVFQNSYPVYQVIVMDNGSTDGSVEKIKEWAEGNLETEDKIVRYTASNKPIPYVELAKEEAEKGETSEVARKAMVLIQNGADLGIGGNNSGIVYAINKGDADFIWLLNNDTVMDAEALVEMVNCAGTDERIGIVGSKLLYYDRPDTLQAAGGGRLFPWMGNATHVGANEKDTGQWDRAMDMDFITGASLLMKTSALEKTGLIDGTYFLGWEDADLNVRARKNGYRILYCPGSRVWHKEGGTVGRINPARDYYWVRNGLYFTKKFYPYFLPLVPFSYLAKHTLIRALKKETLNFRVLLKGFWDFMKGKTGE